MQSNTRPAEPSDAGAPDADPSATLAAEVTSAIAGARRRAARDADRQVDTAHLLHSLLECDPRVRELFEPAQLARLLGYLVQRSIGFGLQWQASVEDSGQLPVVPPAPDERGADPALPWVPPESGSRGQPGWSPAAATAFRRAVARARGRSGTSVEGLDLLAAVLVDADNRAVDVLRFGGVDPVALGAALRR